MSFHPLLMCVRCGAAWQYHDKDNPPHAMAPDSDWHDNSVVRRECEGFVRPTRAAWPRWEDSVQPPDETEVDRVVVPDPLEELRRQLEHERAAHLRTLNILMTERDRSARSFARLTRIEACARTVYVEAVCNWGSYLPDELRELGDALAVGSEKPARGG